mgnify:CR=1 FL=1
MAITIPYWFAREVGIKAGDEAEYKVRVGKSKLIVKFTKKAKQIALFK